MKQKVVIIGHGYTSRLGIIRSLAELDCDITIIAVDMHNWLGRMCRLEIGRPLDGFSKNVNRCIYCLKEDEEALIDILTHRCADPKQKVIIIPDSDWSAATVDKYYEQLKTAFIIPNVKHTAGLVKHWMDKTRQKQLAEEVGLNVAKGQVVSVKGGRYVMPEDVSYPCFTKALITISGGKQFLRRCDDKKALRAVLDEVARRFETDVLIEDFKTIDDEYAVLGFSDGENVVIPGVIEFVANSQSHFGIAREGRIRPVDGFEPLIALFQEYVRKMGFYGLFDIDFYKSGDEFYFGEMNLRFGGSGYAVTAMGVNLPAMMVKSMRGESIDDMPKKVTGTASYANERMCMDDYLHDYISRDEYKKILSRSEINFIKHPSDRGPQMRLRLDVMLMYFRRMYFHLKKLIR